MTFKKLIEIGNKRINYLRINKRIKSGDCVCVIESTGGSIYVANSVSFSGIVYCAEQVAILSMINDQHYEIVRLVTISKDGEITPPCGRCLELISQTDNCEKAEIAISANEYKHLCDLYPYDWKSPKAVN